MGSGHMWPPTVYPPPRRNLLSILRLNTGIEPNSPRVHPFANEGANVVNITAVMIAYNTDFRELLTSRG